MATKKKAAPKKRKTTRGPKIVDLKIDQKKLREQVEREQKTAIKSPTGCSADKAPSVAQACDAGPERLTVAQVANRCLGELGYLNHADQNAALAVIFNALKASRQNHATLSAARVDDAQHGQRKAEKNLRDLENVGLGLFSVFQS